MNTRETFQRWIDDAKPFETVVLPVGAFTLDGPLRIPGWVSVVSAGQGRRSTRLWFKGRMGACIAIQGGFGGVFRGIEIRPNHKIPRTVILQNVSSYSMEHWGIYGDIKNPGRLGLLIAGRESIKISDFNIAHFQTPISYRWGDNVRIRDFDITGSDNGGVIFDLRRAPHQMSIEQGTTQKGSQVVRCIGAASKGNCLSLHDIRPEQLVNDGSWAIEIDPRRDDKPDAYALEALSITCVRYGKPDLPALRIGEKVQAVHIAANHIVGIKGLPENIG